MKEGRKESPEGLEGSPLPKTEVRKLVEDIRGAEAAAPAFGDSRDRRRNRGKSRRDEVSEEGRSRRPRVEFDDDDQYYGEHVDLLPKDEPDAVDAQESGLIIKKDVGLRKVRMTRHRPKDGVDIIVSKRHSDKDSLVNYTGLGISKKTSLPLRSKRGKEIKSKAPEGEGLQKIKDRLREVSSVDLPGDYQNQLAENRGRTLNMPEDSKRHSLEAFERSLKRGLGRELTPEEAPELRYNYEMVNLLRSQLGMPPVEEVFDEAGFGESGSESLTEKMAKFHTKKLHQRQSATVKIRGVETVLPVVADEHTDFNILDLARKHFNEGGESALHEFIDQELRRSRDTFGGLLEDSRISQSYLSLYLGYLERYTQLKHQLFGGELEPLVVEGGSTESRGNPLRLFQLEMEALKETGRMVDLKAERLILQLRRGTGFSDENVDEKLSFLDTLLGDDKEFLPEELNLGSEQSEDLGDLRIPEEVFERYVSYSFKPRLHDDKSLSLANLREYFRQLNLVDTDASKQSRQFVDRLEKIMAMKLATNDPLDSNKPSYWEHNRLSHAFLARCLRELRILKSKSWGEGSGSTFELRHPASGESGSSSPKPASGVEQGGGSPETVPDRARNLSAEDRARHELESGEKKDFKELVENRFNEYRERLSRAEDYNEVDDLKAAWLKDSLRQKKRMEEAHEKNKQEDFLKYAAEFLALDRILVNTEARLAELDQEMPEEELSPEQEQAASLWDRYIRAYSQSKGGGREGEAALRDLLDTSDFAPLADSGDYVGMNALFEKMGFELENPPDSAAGTAEPDPKSPESNVELSEDELKQFNYLIKTSEGAEPALFVIDNFYGTGGGDNRRALQLKQVGNGVKITRWLDEFRDRVASGEYKQIEKPKDQEKPEDKEEKKIKKKRR